MPTRKYKTPAAARAARLKKMSEYRRESYARAAKVVPPVRLDAVQAAALQKIMDAEQVGPGDAVRHALVTTAAKIQSTASRGSSKTKDAKPAEQESVDTGFGRLPAGAFRSTDLNEEQARTLDRWFAHAEERSGEREASRRARSEKALAAQAATLRAKKKRSMKG
jgi:Mg-chelatase subunit ChlI